MDSRTTPVAILALCLCNCMITSCLEEAITVTIYYEALCPDSMDFFKNQIGPDYGYLKDHVNVQLIPFGKASYAKVNGKWKFDCQHGSRECLGNAQQACALSQDVPQTAKVNFVTCVMSRRYPAAVTTIEHCGKKTGIDWQQVVTCSQNNRGGELLSRYGDKTYDMDPSLSFVPTIVYDNVYDHVSQEDSLTNWAGTVCSKIAGLKPQICDVKKTPRRFHGWWS